MPVLRETEFKAQVVWLGHVPANQNLRAQPVDQLQLEFSGDRGARHEGVNRSSCVRVKNLYPQGTEIRNVRQLTILSAEELDSIAAEMGLKQLDPALLGASVVLRGIPDFTHIPPSSRLQAKAGATVTVDMENRPCVLPGREIEAETPGYGAAFKPAAQGRRGVTAWVERPGTLAIGEKLTLFVPDQRAWSP
ncbi:MAG: MOSC domain-containing protein [Ruegeria sp.]